MLFAVVFAAALAVFHSAVAECQPDPNAVAPHVVFFLVDDLGWNDISFNNPAVNTPNLQYYGDNGIILDQNYVQPVCSPSRGALQAGKFAHRIGMQHTVISGNNPDCVPLSNTLLPQELKNNGYATHFLGKWHLGFCDERCTPLQRGYDTFYGFYNSWIDHYSHAIMNRYDFYDGDEIDWSAKGHYTEDLLLDRAKSIIANHDDSTSMFLMYSDPLVHTPIQLPDHLPGRGDRTNYLKMATAMDEAFGEVVQALKDKGIYDNSVIIFSSDNGGGALPRWGSGPSWASNAPLRGGKSTLWEGGTRVAGMVHSPLQTVTGVRSQEMIHIVDWYPTILALAGACPVSDVDGVSQVDLILNNGQSARTEFVYNIDQYHPYTYGNAIRMGDFKLVRGYPGAYDGYHGDVSMTHTRLYDPFGINDEPIDFEVPVGWTDDDIYAKKAEGHVLLFNVMQDPEERNDLSAQMPDKVAEMSARMDEYLAEAKDIDVAYVTSSVQAAFSYGGIWSPGWCDASVFG